VVAPARKRFDFRGQRDWIKRPFRAARRAIGSGESVCHSLLPNGLLWHRFRGGGITAVRDEFLTRCDAVIEGPDLGRSKAVLYLLIAQDLSQIEMKYSKANIETIVSTTAAKLILPLNNEQTAKRFASVVGKTTVRRRSTSHQSGYTKEAVNLSSNVSDSYQCRSRRLWSSLSQTWRAPWFGALAS
jgi:hypothetical protein